MTLRRQVSNPISVALTSQLVTFTEAAPVLESRRLYWDPKVFVSSGLQVEARARTISGWDVYGRLTGGAGLVRERNANASNLVAQFSTEAGVRYDTRRITFNGALAYLRGRAHQYCVDALQLGPFHERCSKQHCEPSEARKRPKSKSVD